MGYPRQCPICDVPHAPPFEGTSTIERRSGGMADPRMPGRAGAILRLSCRGCGSQYWWDFFASAVVFEQS
jgi:hypothetical protein